MSQAITVTGQITAGESSVAGQSLCAAQTRTTHRGACTTTGVAASTLPDRPATVRACPRPRPRADTCPGVPCGITGASPESGRLGSGPHPETVTPVQLVSHCRAACPTNGPRNAVAVGPIPVSSCTRCARNEGFRTERPVACRPSRRGHPPEPRCMGDAAGSRRHQLQVDQKLVPCECVARTDPTGRWCSPHGNITSTRAGRAESTQSFLYRPVLCRTLPSPL